MKIKSFIIFLAMVAQTVSAQSLFMKECRQRHFPKEIPPGNYSGITYLGHNDYAVVSDKSEEDGFFIFNITVDSISGEIKDVRNKGFHGIGTRHGDLEGIAFDSSSDMLYLCSEAKSRIVEYDMKKKKPTGRTLDLTPYYIGMEGNGGMESLCLDKENRLLWTINEKPLRQDATDGGYILRLKSFDMDFRNTATYMYRMDAPVASGNDGYTHVVGVSEVAAVGKGTLVILEREFYVPKIKVGAYCICKLYSVRPTEPYKIHNDRPAYDDTRFLEKEKLTEWKTTLSLLGRSIANYEGMCIGPELGNGNMTLILVADSQNQFKGVLKDWFKSVVLSPIYN